MGRKVVFIGSGRFGLPTLRNLAAGLKQGWEIAHVFTRCPRPAGRGRKLQPTPVAQLAQDLSLPVIQTPNINAEDCIEQIKQISPDVILVIDFGQKISSQLCNIAKLGAINLHGSLLPELRGPAPVNWAIIRGYSRTGVSVIFITEQIDAGAIITTRETIIKPDETAQELENRLAELGVEAVNDALDQLASGEVQEIPQDESRVTKAPKLKKTDGWLRFDTDAKTIRNLIHGTWPWPGGQARFIAENGKSTDVIIARAEAIEQSQPSAQGIIEQCTPGTIDKDLTICCKEGKLKIIQIKPSGKRLMDWQDFVNGYRVKPGTRFESPIST